jgi:hypothetical protein
VPTEIRGDLALPRKQFNLFISPHLLKNMSDVIKSLNIILKRATSKSL